MNTNKAKDNYPSIHWCFLDASKSFAPFSPPSLCAALSLWILHSHGAALVALNSFSSWECTSVRHTCLSRRSSSIDTSVMCHCTWSIHDLFCRSVFFAKPLSLRGPPLHNRSSLSPKPKGKKKYLIIISQKRTRSIKNFVFVYKNTLP